MSKSPQTRRRHYAHIRHMIQEMGIDYADVLAFAGSHYQFDNGAVESISDLSDDDLDHLIISMRGYQEFHRLIMLNASKALGLASRIVQVYLQEPLTARQKDEDGADDVEREGEEATPQNDAESYCI